MNLDFIENYEDDKYKSDVARERRLERIKDVKRDVTRRQRRKQEQEQEQCLQIKDEFQHSDCENTGSLAFHNYCSMQHHEGGKISLNRRPKVALSTVLKRLDQLSALEQIIRTGGRARDDIVKSTECENMIIQFGQSSASQQGYRSGKLQQTVGEDATCSLTFSRVYTRAELRSPSKRYFAANISNPTITLFNETI